MRGTDPSEARSRGCANSRRTPSSQRLVRLDSSKTCVNEPARFKRFPYRWSSRTPLDRPKRRSVPPQAGGQRKTPTLPNQRSWCPPAWGVGELQTHLLLLAPVQAIHPAAVPRGPPSPGLTAVWSPRMRGDMPILTRFFRWADLAGGSLHGVLRRLSNETRSSRAVEGQAL